MQEHLKKIKGPLIDVQTAVGLDVSLPCDLLPTTMAMMTDKVYLVIWYKEGNTKPIYSFDARGKSLQQAIHWSDEAVLKSKAYFYYDTNPPALRIKGVKQEDAGLYRCRVDFHKSPTKNCRIQLDVLVPPAKITILDEQGAAVLNNVVGPYRENADINMTCISSGGQPAPKVTWWREHALLDDSYLVLPDGTVKNVLYLEKLSRHDLHSVYTCQASNGHVVPPLSSAVKLDMKLPPLYVRMQGLRETLTAGVKTQVSCTTAGSRPAPSVVWTKGSSVIRGSSQTTSNDGNVTVSELVFVPGPEDNEKSITCSISYSEGDGPTVLLKDTHVLNVKHVPVISLALGAPLNSQNLMEGSDVYLECDIKANPPVKKIEWFHNNKLLQSARGIIVSNQTLVLQSITKSTHGEYMCRASNSEGTVNSNQLYLDIKYPPVCKSEAQIIRAAVKQTVNITCDIDANPMPNLLFRWQFNNSLESMLELPPYTNVESEAANLALAEIDLETNHMGPSLEEMVRKKLERLEHSVRQQQLQQQQQHHHHLLHSGSHKEEVPLVDGQLYMYRVDTFNSFGTITCTATNSYGQSGHCAYHILVAGEYFVAAHVPDPIKSCTVSNVTAYTVHISCVAGKDGGIPQQFHIDVSMGKEALFERQCCTAKPERYELFIEKLNKQLHWPIVKAISQNLSHTSNNAFVVSFARFVSCMMDVLYLKSHSAPRFANINLSERDRSFDLHLCPFFATCKRWLTCCFRSFALPFPTFPAQVFEESKRKLLQSVSYQSPEMLLKKLPSDTKFIIKITPYNLQGTAPTSYRVKAQTLPAPLLRTAPSKAVLVQLTPLLGALVGAAVTLCLVALCIIVFVKFKTKVSKDGSHHQTASTEQDKGSAEPLSRNIGSHSSIDDKNPDVIPHENSEDDDEKQFERLALNADGLKFAGHTATASSGAYSPTHHHLMSPSGNGFKKFGELSLTTNPGYAIYSSPIRSYGKPSPGQQQHQLGSLLLSTTAGPQGTTTTTTSAPAGASLLLTSGGPGAVTTLPTRTSPNIYTRLPLRDFTPNSYDSMLSTSQTTSCSSSSNGGYATSQIYTAKMPLLTTNYTALDSTVGPGLGLGVDKC
ncbi:AGAP001925-PA [Anopheles gambiae str. PEST]|uniref:AGAP001925-PA n=1 Tax=Anopheles gambiae TaxID=7165 RepID=Q7PYG1_ANOGA|nr:AGAP001925-PA [Anopheles gambiae str. PEST]